MRNQEVKKTGGRIKTMTEKKYQNKEWLNKQYTELNRKVIDIAKECNVNRITIGRWRKRFEIPSRKFQPETIEKMSRERRGKNLGKDNHNWKGNNVGYHCLHRWVRKNKPKPDSCQKCGKKQDYLEVANISGEYKRDIDDYIYLCVRCHKEMDGKLESFTEGGINTRFKENESPWNKNLPSEMQPNYGKKQSKKSIEKIRKAKMQYWEEKKIEKVNPVEDDPIEIKQEVYDL